MPNDTTTALMSRGPQGRRALCNEDVRALVGLYVNDGLGLERAGRMVGVSHATAARYLRDAGVEVRSPGGHVHEPDLRARARCLHENGMASADICRHMRVAHSTMRSWLR